MNKNSNTQTLRARDGVPISYKRWDGKRDGGIIIYLHGIESHVGWFTGTGDLLSRKGFYVYAADRRGSGLNRADRGHMESYWTLVDDVKEIVTLARSEHPEEKIYLMGLCWGCKTAVTFAAYNHGLIDALILLSPAIKTKANLPLSRKFDVVLSSVFRPRKLFDVPLEDCMFTESEKYLDFIKNDRLKLTRVTAKFFYETGKMNFLLNRIAHKIEVPVLVLLAGKDAIVDNRGVKKWFAKIGAGDKTLKTYDGCSHSLEFEDSISDITDYIAAWTKERSRK